MKKRKKITISYKIDIIILLIFQLNRNYRIQNFFEKALYILLRIFSKHFKKKEKKKTLMMDLHDHHFQIFIFRYLYSPNPYNS